MKKSYTLFTGLVLLAASLVFTGCENFLSGNNLKKELEEKIQYEKKPAYTISVELEKAEYGQCNLYTFKLKEGESIALTFTQASGYNFKRWECNDPEAIEFSPADSGKTTVTLKKGKTDLIITPVCAEVFGVKNILPEKKDGGVPCDSPIILTFTHSIKPESLGTIGDDYKILIAKEDGTDLSEFYGAPVFSENNTVVKFPAIREKPVIENGTLNIEVIVKAGIESEAGETIADKYSYKFKVNSSRDSDAPLFIDFKVTSKKPSFNQTLETLSEEYDSFKDKITIDGETLITEIPESTSYEVSEQFHIKDKLYIYCKAEDKGSGAYRLVCDSISFPTAESGKKFVLTSENIYEIDDCEIDLSSYPDGEIELTFKLYDYCNNECPDTKVYKVIKDTKIEQDGVKIYNELPKEDFTFVPVDSVFKFQYTIPRNAINGGLSQSNDYELHGASSGKMYYLYDNFTNFYKKIYVDGIENDSWLSKSSKFELGKNVKLYYGCDDSTCIEAKFEYDRFIIEDVDSLEDTMLKVEIIDSVGNKKTITRYLPTSNVMLESAETSTSLELHASKDSLMGEPSEIIYNYFFEHEWNDTTINLFNNSDAVQESMTIFNSLTSTYANENWISSVDIQGWKTSVFNKSNELAGRNIEKNKKYIVGFDYYSNYYNYVGVGPTSIPMQSYVLTTSINNNYVIKNLNHSSALNLSDSYIDRTKPLKVYAIPCYRYDQQYLYGSPVSRYIVLSNIQYSDDYTISFTPSEIVSSGINKGTCDFSFNDISIVDSENKNCLDEFELEFYYKTNEVFDSSSHTFVTNNITIPSVSETKTYIVGIRATHKENGKVVKTEKNITMLPVDNYPPKFYLSNYSTTYYETYNLFDSDRTGKMFYIDLQGGKYSDGSWDNSWKYNYLLNDNEKKIRAYDGKYDYEFYWIKDDMVRKEFPALTDEDFPYVLKGSSKFDWNYSEENVKNYDSKMWVPVYDLDDDNYILVVKMYDENENYTIKPITYNQVDTYKSKPEVNLSGSTLSFQLNVENQVKVDWPNYMSFARKVYFAGISYLDSSTNKWKEINYDNELTKDVDYYSGEYVTMVNGSQDVSVADGKFVKLGIQGFNADSNYNDKYATGRRSNGCYDGLLNLLDPMYAEINSYPVYKYIGSATCNLYNMIEGSAGISIITDGPVLIHTLYSTREEGYGDNIDEWERRAREWNPVQINKNSNYTGYKNLPSDAKSYVVVAYFANGERVISSVYHKE